MPTPPNAQPTTNRPTRGPKPTPRQLKYLRTLAMQRGESFTPPRTAAEASREIDRLKGRKRTPAADVRRERRQLSLDMATRRGDDAQVREHETRGYGSTATWNRDTPTPAYSRPAVGATNPPKELGRYTARSGERVVIGQRVLGKVRVTDIPATGTGRRYVIERQLESLAALTALVSDYLQQAADGTIPAAPRTGQPA